MLNGPYIENQMGRFGLPAEQRKTVAHNEIVGRTSQLESSPGWGERKCISSSRDFARRPKTNDRALLAGTRRRTFDRMAELRKYDKVDRHHRSHQTCNFHMSR